MSSIVMHGVSVGANHRIGKQTCFVRARACAARIGVHNGCLLLSPGTKAKLIRAQLAHPSKDRRELSRARARKEVPHGRSHWAVLRAWVVLGYIRNLPNNSVLAVQSVWEDGKSPRGLPNRVPTAQGARYSAEWQ
jgi:hypothetical protein